MKPLLPISIRQFRALWEETIAPHSSDSPGIIHTATRLTAVGIGMMSILLWIALCVELVSGTSILGFFTHLLAVLSLAALSIQMWRGQSIAWIGLKALIAFFVFIQSVEAMIQLANVYHSWQYDWTFAAVWPDGVSLFISSFTMMVSLCVLVFLNRTELRSFFGISSHTQRTTDFFIGIFAAIMLTIASLG